MDPRLIYRINHQWIGYKDIVDSFKKHFVETGEMREDQEILGFRFINELENTYNWINVETNDRTLGAKVRFWSNDIVRFWSSDNIAEILSA